MDDKNEFRIGIRLLSAGILLLVATVCSIVSIIGTTYIVVETLRYLNVII